MENNQKEALQSLMGGAIVIVILIGIFTNWLEFAEAIAIIGAIIIILITMSLYFDSPPETRIIRAITGFIIGLGVEIILIGIFTDWLDFEDTIAIAGALTVIFITVTMYLEAPPETKVLKALTGFTIGLGVEIILIGIFTDWLDFGLALIISVTIWILAGVAGTYFGLDDKSQLKQRFTDRATTYRYSAPVQEQQKQAYTSPISEKKGKSAIGYCHLCGTLLEEDSLFCSNCGERVE